MTIAPAPDRTPTMRLIIEAAAAVFGLTPLDLVSDRRVARLVEARFAVAHAARKLTTLSYARIGFYLGDRDHSTIRHAEERALEMIAGNAEFAEKVDELLTALQLAVDGRLVEHFAEIDVLAVAREVVRDVRRARVSDQELQQMALRCVGLEAAADLTFQLLDLIDERAAAIDNWRNSQAKQLGEHIETVRIELANKLDALGIGQQPHRNGAHHDERGQREPATAAAE